MSKDLNRKRRKIEELELIGRLEGYQIISRVYSPRGIAPTIGASHLGGGQYKLILVEVENERAADLYQQ